MRLIGTLEDEDQARVLNDYLTQLHIENQIALEADGTCEIWIISEDDVERATGIFAQFIHNPHSSEYSAAAGATARYRKQKQKENRDHGPYIDAQTTIFNKGASAPKGNLTIFLVIVSVAVAIFSSLGDNFDFLGKLFITEIRQEGAYIRWLPGLPEIMNGQFWRLITPIFIHFGIMHLGFNMLWLWDLGNLIENRKGSLFMGTFVVVVAIFSNLGQYLVSSPSFGGMSGVVYGLLGYIWMKGKFDPNSRMGLHKTTVTMMLIWFVLCFTGLMGNVANAAHAGGLVIGVAWGYLTTPHFKRLLKR